MTTLAPKSVRRVRRVQRDGEDRVADIPEAEADTPAVAGPTLTIVADIPAVGALTRAAGATPVEIIPAEASVAPLEGAGSDSPGAVAGVDVAALAAWAERAGD